MVCIFIFNNLLLLFIFKILFFSVEDTIRKLTKEMKKYIEAVINLDRADQRLTLNLTTCGLVHLNDEFRKVVENYHSVTTQVNLFLFYNYSYFIIKAI